MNKFVLLVTFMVSLVAAGRITVNPEYRELGLDRLSLGDLQRQKFILDIVQRVQQPLQQNDLLQLDEGLIVDPQRYIGGIDGEMQRVIALDRQRQLLDENQMYSVAQVEHIQQLRGIYRLLVRSDSFETFRRNVVYLRRNINPVLLVNALALALPERRDTQNLIMPAISEILPELYLDQQVIERVRQNVSQRPLFLDVVGIQRVNPVFGILNPFRELHMQMALRRQQARLSAGEGQEGRVVVSIDNQDIPSMGLFTEDIALRSFVQNLIQELALREERESLEQELGLVDGTLLRVNRRRQQNQEQDQDQEEYQYQDRYQYQPRTYGNERERFLSILRRDDDDENIVRRGSVRVPLQRDYIYKSYGRQGGVEDLPTVNVNSDRLLHVSRRRLSSIQQERDQERQQEQQQFGRRGYIGSLRGERFSEGRRVQQEEGQDDDYYNNKKNYGQRVYEGRQQNYEGRQKNYEGRQQGYEGRQQSYEGRQQNYEERQQGYEGRQRSYDQDITGYLAQGQRYESKNYRQNVDQPRDYNVYRNYRDQQRDYQRYDNENVVNQRPIDRLESVERDDERLVHINRRRLGQEQYQNQQQQQQRFYPRRGNTIDEGRRVVDGGLIQDEDIVKFIRQDNRLKEMSDDEIVQMLQRNREERRQKQQQVNQSDDNNDDDNYDEVRQGGRRSRRSLVQSPVENYRRNEVLLHTLRQLVARLNQEKISLGQDSSKYQRGGQQYLYNNRQTQEERYAIRLNDMRLDSRRSREVLQQINDIERRLETVIGQEVGSSSYSSYARGRFDEQRQVEGRIADVLLGRLGQVGIVNILRQLIRENPEQINRLSLSDPVVQHTLRRIVGIVDEQREQLLGGYRREELYMQGVTINDARLDKLRTRYEDSEIDLTNLIDQQQQQRSIIGRQRRLNNKDFIIDLDISSERPQDVIVRMFLGPREDQQGRDVPLEQRRRDFVLLDAINVQLQSGRNRIQRRSIDIPWTTRDVTPYTEIYRRVMLQLRGQQDNFELIGENGRFPQRLLLPRGRPEGLPMQLLVIVSPLQLDERRVERRIPGVVMGIGSSSIQDIRPLGYPLDRRIDNEEQLIQLPNLSVQDVLIYQEN
ncbi:fat-body protein 1 [Drosophila tropicalis]|uniref:fat-body protein 1 n=1 Tax=Drosophila tropicalis TaxID=46794 RepID=UPI0035ABC4B4